MISLEIFFITFIIILTLVLYSIVLHTNEEEKLVPLSALESMNGMPLKPEEAVMDTEVVWLSDGNTPYKATIVGTRKVTPTPTRKPNEKLGNSSKTSPELNLAEDCDEEQELELDDSSSDSGSKEGTILC